MQFEKNFLFFFFFFSIIVFFFKEQSKSAGERRGLAFVAKGEEKEKHIKQETHHITYCVPALHHVHHSLTSILPFS